MGGTTRQLGATISPNFSSLLAKLEAINKKKHLFVIHYCLLQYTPLFMRLLSEILWFYTIYFLNEIQIEYQESQEVLCIAIKFYHLFHFCIFEMIISFYGWNTFIFEQCLVYFYSIHISWDYTCFLSFFFGGSCDIIGGTLDFGKTLIKKFLCHNLLQ